MKKMPPLPKRPRHPQRWRDDELSESSRLEEETRNTYRYLISHFLFISSIRALLRVILFNSSGFFRAFLPHSTDSTPQNSKDYYRPESITFQRAYFNQVEGEARVIFFFDIVKRPLAIHRVQPVWCVLYYVSASLLSRPTTIKESSMRFKDSRER